MTGEKRVRPVQGCGLGGDISGYEIHAGRTTGADCSRPMLHLADGADGATSPDGRVQGTYVHGLFVADGFRRAWLERLRSGAGSALAFESGVDRALDDLADGVAAAVDIDALLAEAQPAGWVPPSGP
jgi:adenosylcobyric acid synthase